MRTAIGLAEPEDRAVELARLRECLWFRVMLGAAREHSLNDHLIEQFREVGRQMSGHGKKAARDPMHRRWGRWLVQVGRGLNDFARRIESAR